MALVGSGADGSAQVVEEDDELLAGDGADVEEADPSADLGLDDPVQAAAVLIDLGGGRTVSQTGTSRY